MYDAVKRGDLVASKSFMDEMAEELCSISRMLHVEMTSGLCIEPTNLEKIDS